MAEKRERDTRRETRLLLLVVAVSLAVLVLLAQWRFPATDLAMAPPSAAPLAGLAARASFDEMANTLADVLGRVSPSLAIVRLDVPAAVEGRVSRGRGTPGEAPPHPVRRAVVLRVDRDLGLVHLPRGLDPFTSGDREAAIEVVARDDARELALVRLPMLENPQDLLASAVPSFAGLSFTAVIEPTPTAPTIRPLFIGRADSILDPRWSHPLFVTGPFPEPADGAFLFSIGGRLIGLMQRNADGPVIVPAAALGTVASLLMPATVAP